MSGSRRRSTGARECSVERIRATSRSLPRRRSAVGGVSSGEGPRTRTYARPGSPAPSRRSSAARSRPSSDRRPRRSPPRSKGAPPAGDARRTTREDDRQRQRRERGGVDREGSRRAVPTTCPRGRASCRSSRAPHGATAAVLANVSRHSPAGRSLDRGDHVEPDRVAQQRSSRRSSGRAADGGERPGRRPRPRRASRPTAGGPARPFAGAIPPMPSRPQPRIRVIRTSRPGRRACGRRRSVARRSPSRPPYAAVQPLVRAQHLHRHPVAVTRRATRDVNGSRSRSATRRTYARVGRRVRAEPVVEVEDREPEPEEATERASAVSRQTESGPPDTITRTRSPGRSMSCSRTVAVTRVRTRATAGGRRARHGLSRATRATHGPGSADLLERRQVRGCEPDPVEAVHARRARPLRARTTRPASYCCDLLLEADRLLERRARRPRPCGEPASARRMRSAGRRRAPSRPRSSRSDACPSSSDISACVFAKSSRCSGVSSRKHARPCGAAAPAASLLDRAAGAAP